MAPANPTADPQVGHVANVIAVKVADKELVQVVVGNIETANVNRRFGANVEKELVAVAQLHQETGGCLRAARQRQARAAGHDAHLIGAEFLGPRKVSAQTFPRRPAFRSLRFLFRADIPVPTESNHRNEHQDGYD